MSHIIKGVCAKQVYDSKKCILYYPGDVEEALDLESEVALSFTLNPDQRKIARAAEAKRNKEREDEKEEMKKEGFTSIYDFRQFKKMVNEDSEVAEILCNKCGKAFDTAAQLRGHNMGCGKKEAAAATS